MELGEKAGTEVLRDAGKAALEPVLADMVQHAGYDPEGTDHMRDSIKIRSRSGKTLRGYRSGVVKLTVGPSKKQRMKALAQEIGTIKQSPKPFIRPALEYNKIQVLKILSRELKDRLLK